MPRRPPGKKTEFKQPQDNQHQLFLRRPQMTPEGHERARQALITAGIVQPSEREYKLLDKVDREGRPFQTWERPDMPTWMVANLRERLVKKGVIKPGAGFQKLIDQGVLYPTSTYGRPEYVQFHLKPLPERKQRESFDDFED